MKAGDGSMARSPTTSDVFNAIGDTHRRAILDTVIPLGGPADCRVHIIAGHYVDGHPVAPGIVNGHRGMLQPNRSVSQDCHRLAFHFEVTVRHGYRGFFVTIRNQLGIAITTVVDDGLLHTAKTGSRIGADILETQRFDRINHVVRTATVGR